MPHLQCDDVLIDPDDWVLVTGASGFIGSKVVEALLDHGFRNLRCLVRSSRKAGHLKSLMAARDKRAHIEVVEGNLLSLETCEAAAKDVTVIFHLAAARGEKSIPDAFLNSVVTTRNLLEAALRQGRLRRFVNVSSFAVYANTHRSPGGVLDETCPVRAHPERDQDAYSFAKIKQEEIVSEYGKKFGLPYVMVRPGWVYGPGNEAITGRVGISTFGIFLHLGGSNKIPCTYVANCAEAIVLAGLKKGVDGEIFNLVDDEPYTSRQFLRAYKRSVRYFRSLYVPHALSYLLCSLWELYSKWSEGQLPGVFSRALWRGYWKRTRYTNQKLKSRLGWTQKISTEEALARYFEACRRKAQHA